MRISLANKKEQGALSLQKALLIPRDLDGIQTHDLQNRNLTLYSAKLQGQDMYNLPCTIYNFQQSPHEHSGSLPTEGSSMLITSEYVQSGGRGLPYIVTLITYTTAAGIAIRDESNLSSIPP